MLRGLSDFCISKKMEKLNVDAQGDVGNGLACLQQAMIPNLQLKCSGRHQFVSGTLSLNISHIESLATGILSGSPIEQEEIHHPFCDCSPRPIRRPPNWRCGWPQLSTFHGSSFAGGQFRLGDRLGPGCFFQPQMRRNNSVGSICKVVECEVYGQVAGMSIYIHVATCFNLWREDPDIG